MEPEQKQPAHEGREAVVYVQDQAKLLSGDGQQDDSCSWVRMERQEGMFWEDGNVLYLIEVLETWAYFSPK